MEKKKIEDVVLIVILTIGLILGVVFYFHPEGKPLSSIFLTLSLTSLLYRFLGGIAQDTSFSVGLFKLGGSAAFMIGSIWFINSVVFKEAGSGVQIEPREGWFPVSAVDGLPIQVLVADENDSLLFALEHQRASLAGNAYKLKASNDRNLLFNEKDPDFVIGYLDESIQASIESLYEPEIFTLYPYRKSADTFTTNRFPFYIEAHDGYFSIRNKEDRNPVNDRCFEIEPVKKKSRVFSIDEKSYLCIVLQAAHRVDSTHTTESWYSRYLVGELVSG